MTNVKTVRTVKMNLQISVALTNVLPIMEDVPISALINPLDTDANVRQGKLTKVCHVKIFVSNYD